MRKKFYLKQLPPAQKLLIYFYVKGKKGHRVTIKVNQKEHKYILKTNTWEWGKVEASHEELRPGENIIWLTGNPDGRLYPSGDADSDFGHSDYGSENH